MATIQSLPAETLHEILSIVHALDRQDAIGFPSLCAAALVARCWREPSQALLWSAVNVWAEEKGQKLMGSDALGVYPRTSLAIVIEGTLGQAIRDALTKSGAVRSLSFRGADAEFYSSLCPKRLLHLELGSDVADAHPLAPIDIPFRLSTLHLAYGFQSPRLIEATISASSTTLHTISIYAGTPASLQAVLEPLPLLSTTLTRLVLAIRASYVILIFTALAACTALVELSVEISSNRDIDWLIDSDSDDDDEERLSGPGFPQLPAEMVKLRCTLRILGIGVIHLDEWAVPILRKLLPLLALQKLETLDLWFSRETFPFPEDAEALEEECGERGIEVEYSEEGNPSPVIFPS